LGAGSFVYCEVPGNRNEGYCKLNVSILALMFLSVNVRTNCSSNADRSFIETQFCASLRIFRFFALLVGLGGKVLF